MNPTVIIPYLFKPEVQHIVKRFGFNVPYIMEEDTSRIGSDLMYQKLWKKCNTDIIIFHSDMAPTENDNTNQWYRDLIEYSHRYPEAGMLGCKLLYPAKNELDQDYIQCAGGRFTDEGRPDHFGSGIDIRSGTTWKEPEPDVGQYDAVREVAWTTFGGLYIRREVINQIGDFDASFEWTYNRDVDYCLQTRAAGWKIYQVPVSIIHYESKDNKRIKTPQNAQAEQRNLEKLLNKWQNNPLYKTINNVVN